MLCVDPGSADEYRAVDPRVPGTAGLHFIVGYVRGICRGDGDALTLSTWPASLWRFHARERAVFRPRSCPHFCIFLNLGESLLDKHRGSFKKKPIRSGI